LDFIEQCRKVISFDTSPNQSNQNLIDWVKDQALARNLFVELQTSQISEVEQSNIIIRPQPKRPDAEFLLQSHLDTADPGPFQMWKENEFNPFDATILDGKIYGIGTAETKLDFLCKLEALTKFSNMSHWKLPPVLVGTFGEETGMVGAMKLIRKNLISPRIGLIGEPTDLKLVFAAKGFASVEVRIPFSQDELTYRQDHNLRESTSTQTQLFIGKSAHSSMPHLGESAIAKMFDYLNQLPDSVAIMEIDGGTNFNTVPSNAMLELDIQSIKDPICAKLKKLYKLIQDMEMQFRTINDPEFNPPHPTLNIGMIRTYEDHVLFSGNCRIPPLVSQATYMSWMEELKNECQKIGTEFRVSDYKRPFRAAENSFFLKGGLDILRSFNLSTKAETQPSTNESSLFARIGAECLCFGPGKREGNIHTPHEHVEIKDLNIAIQVYESMIERFCL
jgi:acetylornithine deacetylase/succinyl-diaminopimelate desuccinylase-like protein